jgi:hypothetical protein
MNRSRMVAAGTSVGALVAITAGVAAANPAPSSKPPTKRDTRTAQTNRSSGQSSDQGGYNQDDGGGDNGWRQLPPDPSASDPGLSGNSGSNTGNDFSQPPAFDPRAGGSGSNTSSGGS